MAAPKKRKELPDWRRLIATDPELWSRSVERAQAGPRVLFATSIGGQPQFTVVEAALSIALTLRGVRADSLLCDQALPACQRAKVSIPEPQALIDYRIGEQVCGGCVSKGRRALDIPGLNSLQMSHYLDEAERRLAREIATELKAEDLAGFRLEGLPVGEHAKAGALRYFCIGELEREPQGEPVLRRFLEASLLTAFASRRILDGGGYDVVVTNHGIYVPHGVINAAAQAHGTRTVTWNTAYRRQCAIFSHGDTYHHTLMHEPTSDWEDLPWSPQADQQIMSYLHSRRYGTRDWIWFNRDNDEDIARFAAQSGLDLNKPIIGMLTNVVWDAQLHYPANAFPNMLDWMRRTIEYFAGRGDVQLLIRVHPGELTGGVTQSRQRAVDEIHRMFGEIPANVFVVGPESPLSTYALMERCDCAIIYGTKTGVELTSLGIPVIVAGEAWVRNKGLTTDAASVEQYLSILDSLPLGKRLDEATVGRARKYAYHFFFRRMIPLPFLEPRDDSWPPFVVSLERLQQLSAGQYPGLDVICDGIMTGSPFIYPAETAGVHDSTSS